tara:strand:+ start:12545 stop:13525 length:981 start_codon:yes stop_codon:yes gene_type:complete
MDIHKSTLKIVSIILFNKDSGGNIQLRDYSQSLLEPHENVIDISLFNGAIPSPVSFLSLLWYLFNGIFNKNIRLVYSDPLLCILDLLPGINLTRFVQSIDNELYNGHPRIPVSVQKALSIFISFCNRRGFGSIVVCSDMCAEYISLVGRSFTFVKPSLRITLPSEKKINRYQNKICSVMSNPDLKGISLLVQIANAFPNISFVLISQKTPSINLPHNIEHFTPSDRNDMFSVVASCAASISCSSKETLGLPIYEAMALGLPSIFRVNQATQGLDKNLFLAFNNFDKDKIKRIFEILLNNDSMDRLLAAQQELINKNFQVILSNKSA